MGELHLGKIDVLSPRDLWKHEERDFTPWLERNIEHLSTVLGVPIVVDRTEQRVGDYELDILGHVGESDAVVIVENQLGCTDHVHLGQIITYAAGLDAAIIIWVAATVRDEHRSAVEWLNNHMDKKVSFFLVRPEVFRIDDSNPAVRFQLEAAPSEFGRRLKGIAETEGRPAHDFRLKFWEALLSYLADNGHAWAKGRNTTKEPWIASPVGKSGIGANVSMGQGSQMRVEIYCSNDVDKQLFKRLRRHKEDIEAKMAPEDVSWERLEGAASRVAVYRPYDKKQAAEETPHRTELFTWIGKNLATLRTVAKQYLVDE